MRRVPPTNATGTVAFDDRHLGADHPGSAKLGAEFASLQKNPPWGVVSQQTWAAAGEALDDASAC